MHNNYYFLRQLTAELGELLRGFTLVSCFSQNKDELVLEFNDSRKSFFIKASFQPEFQCLSFPSTFHRARKNSVDLFTELIMLPVTGVRQYTNERSFSIGIGEGFQLIFKMHGRQGNVILAQGETVRSLFRNNFPSDLSLRPSLLDRTIDWNYETFAAHQQAIRSHYVTFGTPVWNYLNLQGYSEKSERERWLLIEETLKKLEHPTYSIVDDDGALRFTLLPGGKVLHQFTRPTEALNEFYFLYQSTSSFLREKAMLLSAVRGRLKQGRAMLEKSRSRLDAVQNDHHYQAWADLLMANLHNVPPGSTAIELADFHQPDKRVTIKLRKDLSPQKNAEVFYRKAKNQSIELKTLAQTIGRKEQELAVLEEQERQLESAMDRTALEPYLKAYSSGQREKEKKQTLPYHEHEFGGFRILVGKNATDNDELTLHHAYKEDLWLHAKDVAGSHVLIKYQSGKSFPKDVIEFAASLAAFHSKRKNESLCPVAVTQAKYVRKRKGDAPGMVMVQREDVLMVVPGKGNR